MHSFFFFPTESLYYSHPNTLMYFPLFSAIFLLLVFLLNIFLFDVPPISSPLFIVSTIISNESSRVIIFNFPSTRKIKVWSYKKFDLLWKKIWLIVFCGVSAYLRSLETGRVRRHLWHPPLSRSPFSNLRLSSHKFFPPPSGNGQFRWRSTVATHCFRACVSNQRSQNGEESP